MNMDGELDLSGAKPGQATKIAETGLATRNLLKLALKHFYVRGIQTGRELAEQSRLHIAICKDLLEEAKEQGLVEIRGSSDHHGYSDFRHGLSGKGREWAIDALNQCAYVGPAPVTLLDYTQQVRRQSVMRQPIRRDELRDRFSEMIVPETLEHRLGPAVNSGRSLLLYGASGNGKTTIAEAIAGAFDGIVHVPYAIDIDGEIIKVFDPIYHDELSDRDTIDSPMGQSAERREFTDRRWVPCKRPVIAVGGELTLSMLDLHFSPVSRYYEAPLHLKANGGVFIVDDLGRRLVNPKDLLNRWIVPMEKKIDFMAMQNGATFSIPFDNLFIFSTNLEPMDLMDPAFLRRIPYKVEVKYPSERQFRQVFTLVCAKYGLAMNDGVVVTSCRRFKPPTSNLCASIRRNSSSSRSLRRASTRAWSPNLRSRLPRKRSKTSPPRPRQRAGVPAR